MAIENISQDIADLLATKDYDVKYTDGQGQDSSPEEAKTFAFDWVAGSGQNYGTVVIVIGDDNDLQLFFGDNLGKTMENPQDKLDWFGSERETGFLPELKNFATQHRYTFSPKDINQLKHTMQGMAAIKEGLFEGYYGTRKISYVGEQTEARLVIKHNRMIGEDDKRYRYVESLFIETVDGERFKLPFVKLSGGRAMLEHVKQGGRPYDIRGQHINEIVTEMAVLSRFNRASQQRVFEGITQELVETVQHYYSELRGNLQHMATGRGYNQYFESWTPADIGDETALVEDLKTMFIEQTLDARIEAALPTLAKIQQRGNAMKEAQIFENWVNSIMEGTWALPDTPEAQAKLDELMSKELIVGPDATNATEQLYDVIGDDKLFDILADLAEQDPRANCWDDTDVQARLQELGIQMNTTPDAEQQQPVAPAAGQQAPGTAPEQSVAEGVARSFDPQLIQILKQRGFKGPMGVGKAKKWIPAVKEVAINGNFSIGADDIIMVSGSDPDYDPWVLYVPKVGKYIYNEGMAYNLLTAKQVVKFTVPGDDDQFFEGVAEGSESPEKEIERLKLRQNAEHGGASLKRQAETQARIRELEKAQKNQGMAEAADPESRKFGKYIDKYFGQIYNYGDDGLEYLDKNAPFWTALFDKHNGDIDDIIANEPANVLKQAALELKAIVSDLRYELEEQGMAKDQLDELSPATLSSYGRKAAGQAGWAHGVASALKGPEGDQYAKFQQKRAAGVKQAVGKGANVNMGNVEPYDWAKQGGYGDANNPAMRKRGMAENTELATMLKYAGVPLKESRIHENSEYTHEIIAKTLAREKPGMETLRTSKDFYSAVYHELIAIGMTPRSARNLISYDEDFMGDVATSYNHYQSNPDLDESNSGMIMPETDPIATVDAMPDLSAPIVEGSCNSTMEGEYCPEHGLAECGMYEMGTVAGGMAPVMGEQQAAQDPINYNGAITGAYYESKSDTALLARIKSLALLK